MKNGVTVLHHGRYRRFAVGPPITPVIHDQKIQAQPVVQWPQIVIVRYDFPVAVEEKNIGACFFSHVKMSAHSNPFFDFQVPRAILTLRQGLGRLMRSVTDRGLLAILDARLYGKSYGRLFLKSAPPSPIIRSLDEVRTFFNERE